MPYIYRLTYICIYQIRSVTQSCPTLFDCMNCSTPGLPVHHQLLEFTQTPVHRVSDAIQPSHPLSSPSPAPNLSQHQSLIYRKCLLSCSSLPCSLCFLKSHRCAASAIAPIIHGRHTSIFSDFISYNIQS